MKTLAQAFKASARAVASFGQALSSAVLWFVLMGIGGLGLIVFGVSLVAGLGWAVIAGGVSLLLVCFVLSKGMTNA